MKRAHLKSGWLVAALLVLAGAVWLAGPGSQSAAAQTAVRIFGTLSGAAKAVAVDSTGRLRVIVEGGGAAFDQLVTIVINGIGTTSTDGLRIENNTAAAAGAQQWSPRMCQEGQGWKTTATAGSQSVEFCWEVQPVQGTTAPSGNYILKASINGGAFSTVGTFTSGGQIYAGTSFEAPNGSQTAPSVVVGIAGGLYSRATNVLGFTTGGAQRAVIGNSAFGLVSGMAFGWSNTTDAISSNWDLSLARQAAGTLRVGNGGTPTNTYDITLADWGTTVSAESISVPDAGTVFLGASPLGYIELTTSVDNGMCRVALRGSSNTTAVRTNDGASCSNAKDTASSINVYYDAAGASGAGYYIQNLRGGTRAIRALLIGA